MDVSTSRSLLLLVAGAAVGSLVTFGLLHRPDSIQKNSVEPETASKTSTIAPAQKEEGNENALEPSVVTQQTPESEGTADYRALATLKAAQQQHVPVRPVPKPTMAFGPNGLPVGVTQDAGKSNVYARLPGVQPPLINRDGRDMSREAIQMLQTPREEVPFPGGTTPLPLPQNAEEANGQAEANASPSAVP